MGVPKANGLGQEVEDGIHADGLGWAGKGTGKERQVSNPIRAIREASRKQNIRDTSTCHPLSLLLFVVCRGRVAQNGITKWRPGSASQSEASI